MTARKGERLLRAVEVMDALRAPDGDAWSAEQTHQSLARYLLEETHEVLAVIEDPSAHGPTALADELGDLLFQILFHAHAAETFDIDDVAESFIAKMERRNPHIFGDDAAAQREELDVEAIVAQWHAMKATEGKQSGWFADIPAQLPALQTALKAVHRARSDGSLEKLLEAARAEAAQTGPDAIEGAHHALALLETAVAAEAEDVDPETALRALLRRTERRSRCEDRPDL